MMTGTSGPSKVSSRSTSNAGSKSKASNKGGKSSGGSSVVAALKKKEDFQNLPVEEQHKIIKQAREEYRKNLKPNIIQIPVPEGFVMPMAPTLGSRLRKYYGTQQRSQSIVVPASGQKLSMNARRALMNM